MTIDIEVQVCARELFGASVLWTKDVGRILMIWGCLTGANCGFRARGDMPVVGCRSVRGVLSALTGVTAGTAVAIVVVTLLVSAPGFISRSLASNYDVLELPRAVTAAALPLFACVVGIRLADRALQALSGDADRLLGAYSTKETQNDLPKT